MNKKTTKTIIGVAVALLAGALGISTTQKDSDLVLICSPYIGH